jgi:putative tryptophan/tyrosine transport system substrate-binding protein
LAQRLPVRSPMAFYPIQRRWFLAGLGSSSVSLLTAQAQQPRKLVRLGVLVPTRQGDPELVSLLTVFKRALGMAGWEEGVNLTIDERWWGAGDRAGLRAKALEILGLHPNLLMPFGTPALVAMLPEAQSIATVFVSVSDPVGQGFVPSLAHPGGMMTGFTNYEPSMGGKWLELLKEINPSLKRAILVFNPDTAPYTSLFLNSIEHAALSSKTQVASIQVHSDPEIEAAISAVGSDGTTGFIFSSDSFTAAHRDLIIALTTRYRIPSVYAFRFFASSGGLMSYGVDFAHQMNQAASYADRILRGTNPKDLPVQQPDKFEFVINLKAAKLLGLDVPPQLLATADEVIE